MNTPINISAPPDPKRATVIRVERASKSFALPRGGHFHAVCDVSLDAETTRALLDTLRDINRNLGVTIVIVSHELSVLGAICNRVAVIEDGAIAEQFALADTGTVRKTALGRELAHYGTPAFEATAWKELAHA